MKQNPDVIFKQTVLPPAQDFYRLRREGIGFIEHLASSQWTDYNSHDPGITILETLCFAITDLAYRINWDIQDILTPETKPDSGQAYPEQAFFPAREILTANPVTPDDYRRVLIDLDGIRNAWLSAHACSCELSIYAWCEKDLMRLAYQAPAIVNDEPKVTSVPVLGLYEVLLELEQDPELGDLNDRKLAVTEYVFDTDGKPHALVLELRFPDLAIAQLEAFSAVTSAEFTVQLLRFGAIKTYDLFTASGLTDDNRNQYIWQFWRNVFYVSFTLTPKNAALSSFNLENVSLRFFADGTAKNAATASYLKALLIAKAQSIFIPQYRQKLAKIEQAVASAKQLLHKQRNLAEDYCHIAGIAVEDVSVCADVEVAANVDIERVQAEIFLAIENYFNPPVLFYSLQELVDQGFASEAIFNGPQLQHGFIKADELAAAQLKTVLRSSDLINLLMDIDGVQAVNNLLLSKYDAEGNPIKGSSDPDFNTGLTNADQLSAAWLLLVSPGQQPRFYQRGSRFLFYKNGLPFTARQDEVSDILAQLRGAAERPKLKNADNDYAMPTGTFRQLQDYAPLQYGFPLTYGIGPEGLPGSASAMRQGQARQLKAYLMVFEQLLGNAFAQVADTAKLFSLSPDQQRTYFVRTFSDAVIKGYNEITLGLDESALEKLTETPSEFQLRRNRFLDHLMARFGEQFSEYALLLTHAAGQKVALERLIKDKIAFLQAYPQISHDRGKAFDHTIQPTAYDNCPGLKKRVSLLLGYANLAFNWQLLSNPTVKTYQLQFALLDPHGKNWMLGKLTVDADDLDSAKVKASQIVLRQMVQPAAYSAKADAAGGLKLFDDKGSDLAHYPQPLPTQSDAEAVRDELLAWSANERAIVVEHLLLRPKFIGDALYPVCVDGACVACDVDPYSFQLSYIMPGWTSPYNVNLELRRFADRTIRQELPAHLLAKICWVGNDGFIEGGCDYSITLIADLLAKQAVTSDGTQLTDTQACQCGAAVFALFNKAFTNCFKDKTLQLFKTEELKELIKNEFTALDAKDLTCVVVWDNSLWQQIQTMMQERFLQIAINGWQFERFEIAWQAWLQANSQIDWQQERLHERLVAALAGNAVTTATSAAAQEKELCELATILLTRFGLFFQQWLADKIAAEDKDDSFTPAAFASFVTLKLDASSLFSAINITITSEQAKTDIITLLTTRYENYVPVSYRLSRVLGLLGNLNNTYPAATLHDCDDGSDQNPVRLGSTALGNFPLRSSAT